ncbi:19731_t:CDS:2, partial [Gigaspora margarita]
DNIEIKNLLSTKDLEKANNYKTELYHAYVVANQEGKKKNSIGSFLGKVEKKSPNKKIHILECEKVNKENLLHNSPLESSIVPSSKLLKIKENEVEDSQASQKSDSPRKKPIEGKESKIEHVVLTETWDVYLIRIDEAKWLEKEYSIANQIWSNLDTMVRKRITIKDLYTILTSEKEADRYRKRNYIARGLIELDLATSLLAKGLPEKQQI